MKYKIQVNTNSKAIIVIRSCSFQNYMMRETRGLGLSNIEIKIEHF